MINSFAEISVIIYKILLIETDSKSVQNSVYGIIAKIPVPFRLPNSDGCVLGVNCPVKNGDSLSESVTLPILNEYPKVN